MTRPSVRPLHRFAAIVLCAVLASCSRSPPEPSLPPGTTVVALGDSLTYGTGATRETSYPAHLAKRSGWNVVNAGVPGETAAQGCDRLSELIDEHKPRLVLVLLGGNDFLRRAQDPDVTSGLQHCIQTARAALVSIALIPVPRLGANGLAYPSLYEDLARASAVPLFDAGLDELFAKRTLRADPVHLNAAGYEALAERLAERLSVHGWLAR